MAAYDSADFGNRVRSLLPASWFSTAAGTSGGLLYALTNGLGVGLAQVWSELAYAQKQTRLATATDSNLDQASSDMFGTTLQRQLMEADTSFSTRIRQRTVAPLGTIPAITSAVQSYLGYNAGALQAQIYQLFGLDTFGGLDTLGGLDGFNPSSVIVPQVYVFDAQSDPVMAARLSIAPPQFCVLLLYNAGRASGFFAGRSYASRDYLVNSKIQTGQPLTSSLDTIVRSVKAIGTKPIYGSNYH